MRACPLMLAEPDVALTDYALTLESGLFAWLYHVIEGVALVLLYRAARWWTAPGEAGS